MKKFFKWAGIAMGVLFFIGVLGAIFGDPE